jgi:uncharacterized coiled-coil DUF342 family protein
LLAAMPSGAVRHTVSQEESMEQKQELKDLMAKLRQERDELRVQAHLMRAELRDEWQEFEDRFEKFRSKADHVLDTAGDAGGEMAKSAKELGHEIAEGFRRIRRTMKE